jgi:hypothetical protein
MTPKEILKRVNSLTLDQTVRAEMLQRHFYMYGHSSLHSYGQFPTQGGMDRVRFNLVQSCSDTLLNKISKNSPRPTFLTEDGDWGLQQQAKKREKFVFGQFYKSRYYEQAKKALLQCLVFGDGFVKVYSDDKSKQIKIEPLFTPSLLIDERQAVYGQPSEYFEIRYVDKETLGEIYPDKKELISKAKSELMPFYLSGSVMGSLLMIVEYWKVPYREGEKGEHKIICGEADLLSEEWNRTNPPFAKISFISNVVGYFSKGVAETITPHQLEVNRTLKRISDALRLVASPKVLYDYASKIISGHFNNDVGAMIGYTGAKPDFIMPTAVGPELFTWMQTIKDSAFAEVGLSQLSAQSVKPAGLNSGVSLREYNDIETERFAALAKGWEQLAMDVSEMCLLEAKYLSDKFGEYAVLSPDPKGCEIIQFKDIDMPKDAFAMQCFPTSMLPKTPAGRLEFTQEMLAAGLISPEEGLSLLDFPDTEKITSIKTSELDDILATIDYMLDKDKFLPPEPFQNLQMGVDLMKKSYLKYKNKGCPDEKLDLLIRWINDALVMLSPPQEEPAIDSSELAAPIEDPNAPIDPLMDPNAAMDPAMMPAVDPAQTVMPTI